MHANNDPLGVQSAYRSAGQIGGKALWSSPVAKPALFSSGRVTIVGTILVKCREVKVVPVDKITGRCKEATERARRMMGIRVLPFDSLRDKPGAIAVVVTKSVSQCA
jgi:hypothetical protein